MREGYLIEGWGIDGGTVFIGDGSSGEGMGVVREGFGGV